MNDLPILFGYCLIGFLIAVGIRIWRAGPIGSLWVSSLFFWPLIIFLFWFFDE